MMRESNNYAIEYRNRQITLNYLRKSQILKKRTFTMVSKEALFSNWVSR